VNYFCKLFICFFIPKYNIKNINSLYFQNAINYHKNLINSLNSLNINKGYTEHPPIQQLEQQPEQQSIQLSNNLFQTVNYSYSNLEDIEHFSAVYYPYYYYDIPILTIELIALKNKKYLSAINIYPMANSENYRKKYIDPLRNIKNYYSNSKMSRVEKSINFNTNQIDTLLINSYKTNISTQIFLIPNHNRYIDTYIQTLNNIKKITDIEIIDKIKKKHLLFNIRWFKKII
jgi:hypothetical protein